MKKDILEEAICVAQIFSDHARYRENIRRACLALKRRVPGYSDEKYQSTFQMALQYYKNAIDFVRENQDKFWTNYEKYKEEKDIAGCYIGLDKKFYKSQKGFKLKTVRSTLAWVFYWHCMR